MLHHHTFDLVNCRLFELMEIWINVKRYLDYQRLDERLSLRLHSSQVLDTYGSLSSICLIFAFVFISSPMVETIE